MKKNKRSPILFLYISYYLIKLRDAIFYPLKDIPKPDFNNEYDSGML